MSVPGGVQGGLVAATAAIYKQFGYRGFYKGMSGEIGADMLGFMLGFGLYDLANGLFYRARGRKPRSWEKGLVGGCTACCSISVTMPLMLATTRMQVSRKSTCRRRDGRSGGLTQKNRLRAYRATP